MSFGDRLGSVCADIRAPDGEPHRDWWPIAMVWERQGRSPIRSTPDFVARPGSVEEVAGIARLCESEGVPLTAAGGRSGVCGGSWPVFGGVALDLGGLAGIEDVDTTSGLVTVGAGTNGRAFEDELQTGHGMTAGHWPQSMDLASVGGWVACRGAGQFSTRYGTVADMVEGLEVVLASGEVLRTGWCGPRSAMGPDLTGLFVGSEGTLGVITRVRLRAHDLPTGRWAGAFVFDSFADGLEACRRILRRGATPAVLRLYDPRESRRHFGDRATGSALVILDEADDEVVTATRRIVEAEAAAVGGTPGEAGWVDHWLETRNDVSGLGKAVDAGLAVDTCEIAAPWSAVPSLAEAAPAAVGAVESTIAVSVHASHHYADGACLYITFAGNPEDPDRWYREVWDALMETTRSGGGAISHHHGIGLVRGAYLADALGPAFGVLRATKAALDPKGILNPGKLGLDSPFGAPPRP